MTHTTRAALAAAEAAHNALIEFPVNVTDLARVIRDELNRQEREFLDVLNAEANARALDRETEGECPA